MSFDISDRTIALLGLTTYLLGLALGCLVLAPLSEMYGRRPIYVVTGALYAALILPVALAPNYAAVVASRIFSGFFGSATVASAPGTVNDLISSKHRALAFSLWSLGAMNGPVLGMLTRPRETYLVLMMKVPSSADSSTNTWDGAGSTGSCSFAQAFPLWPSPCVMKLTHRQFFEQNEKRSKKKQATNDTGVDTTTAPMDGSSFART